jgi:hypothetical protein
MGVNAGREFSCPSSFSALARIITRHEPQELKRKHEEAPMQVESSHPSGPPGAAGIGALLAVAMIGLAIILTLLYAFW